MCVLQVMQSTRLGQGAKFFRAEECRDQHGRLQPAPPIVLGPMAADSGLSSAGAKPKMANPSQVGKGGWNSVRWLACEWLHSSGGGSGLHD